MDPRLNFVKDGALQLPPGFRFQPTEEEIVFQYLTRKIFCRPLPASVVPEVNNICNYDPWDLTGDEEQDRYFFSNKEAKYGNGNIANRTTGSGYWKATGTDKKIIYTGRKEYSITGMKKTLAFHQGRPSDGTRTDWIMHEYRLVDSRTGANSNVPAHKSTQIGNWVLCHIFLKQKSMQADNENMNNLGSQDEATDQSHDGSNHPGFHDFIMKREYSGDLSPTSSSCSSSSYHGYNTMTEVSSHNKFLDHEESSSNSGFDNSSPTFRGY